VNDTLSACNHQHDAALPEKERVVLAAGPVWHIVLYFATGLACKRPLLLEQL
jgi:hypothetical protein